MGKRSTEVIRNYFTCTWVLNCSSLTFPIILYYLYELLIPSHPFLHCLSCLPAKHQQLPSPLTRSLSLPRTRISPYSDFLPQVDSSRLPQALSTLQTNGFRFRLFPASVPCSFTPTNQRQPSSSLRLGCRCANRKKILNTTSAFTICLKSLLFLTLFLIPFSSQSSREQADGYYKGEKGYPILERFCATLPLVQGQGSASPEKNCPSQVTHAHRWAD